MSAPSRVGGRVCELVAERTLRTVERPAPSPGPGEAVVRVTAFGICGTDLHSWAGRTRSFPATLGHDAVGTVHQLGAGVEGPEPGRRVVIDPMLSCDRCRYCTSGLRHLCPDGVYLGMGTPGTMAELIVVPAHRLVPVPDGVDDESATVVEPVTVALHLLRRVGEEVADRPAEVVGAGPLGILLAQTLVARGHAVRLHEPREDRRRLARAAGLVVVDVDAAPEAPDGPALVVETSATAPGARRAWDLASRGSVLAVVGRAPWEAPLADVLLRELSVVGVKSGVDQYPAALDLIDHHRARPADVVTHRFGLDQVGTAFEACADPTAGVLRAVVHL